MRDKHRIARLLRDIDEIKAAVQRNSPVLREIVERPLLLAARRGFWRGGDHLLGRHALPCARLPRVCGHPRCRQDGVLGHRGGGERFHLCVQGARRPANRQGHRPAAHPVVPPGGPLHRRVHARLWPPVPGSAALSVYLSHLGLGFFLVAVWAGWFGLTLNLLGFAVHIPEFYVGGYWMLVTGALSILVPGISASLWIAICFGGGSIAYAIVSEVIRRRGGLRGDE